MKIKKIIKYKNVSSKIVALGPTIYRASHDVDASFGQRQVQEVRDRSRGSEASASNSHTRLMPLKEKALPTIEAIAACPENVWAISTYGGISMLIEVC